MGSRSRGDAEGCRGSAVVVLAVGGASRGRARGRRLLPSVPQRRPVVRLGVRGEPFSGDRGAAEQELDVEGGRAAAADAVACVMVLELGDHALGVDHSPS